MKCQYCNDSALVMTEWQGVEIDRCPECRGVWLDCGELDQIIDRSKRADAPQQNFETRLDSVGAYRSIQAGPTIPRRRKSIFGDLFSR